MTLFDGMHRWLHEPVDGLAKAPAPVPEATTPEAPAAPVAAPPVLSARLPTLPDFPVDRARMRAQLVLHEGFKRKRYLDSKGIPSIGIGRNLRAKGLHPDEVAMIGPGRDLDNVGLTDEEIEVLYVNDLGEAIGELDRALPWWRGLDEIRRRVLVDMMFNMGTATLLGFVRTLPAVCAGRYREAAERMLESEWRDQVGNRALRLAAMMGSGRDWVS